MHPVLPMRGLSRAFRRESSAGTPKIGRELCNDGSRHLRVAGRTQPCEHKIDHLIKRRGGLIGKFSDELRMDEPQHGGQNAKCSTTNVQRIEFPGRDAVADHVRRYAE